jgi:hypothetical protein
LGSRSTVAVPAENAKIAPITTTALWSSARCWESSADHDVAGESGKLFTCTSCTSGKFTTRTGDGDGDSEGVGDGESDGDGDGSGDGRTSTR